MTYADTPQWRDYQRFYPQRARVVHEPVEETWAWRGASVHLDRYEARGPVHVVLVHGGGANGRLMAPMGVLLRERGYGAVAPDLPGYGHTAGAPVRYPVWIDLLTDFVAAEAERTGLPIALVGVSLGGMLAYQVACRSEHVAGLVVTTLADPSDPETREQLARTALLARWGLPLARAFGGLVDGVRVPIAWVSRMGAIANDPDIVRLLLADRTAAGSRVPLGFLRSLMESRPEVAPEDFDRCPILLAHPGEDRMTPIAHSDRFFARLKGPKERVVLEGAGHMPLESPGIDQLEAAAFAFLARITETDRREARKA